MPTLQQDLAFIDSIAPDARLFYLAHQVSAAMSIAQGCLESLYGVACPAAHGVNSHNLFGIKADPAWQGPIVTVPTREYRRGKWTTQDAAFRAYPTCGASLIDHGDFLLANPRYKNLIGMNYEQACHTIAAVDGYATDPSYGMKLLEIIAQFGLARYDDAPAQHWAVTVGYFRSPRQAQAAAAKLLTVCGYCSIGMRSAATRANGAARWTVQVGYFASPAQAWQAQAVILHKLAYHSIRVQAVV